LSKPVLLADLAQILQGTAVLLVVCALLLLVRCVLPPRGWVFAADSVTGPRVNAPLAEFGQPGMVEVQIGSTTLYGLIVPVRGQTHRLLKDLRREAVEQVLGELLVFLEGKSTTNKLLRRQFGCR